MRDRIYRRVELMLRNNWRALSFGLSLVLYGLLIFISRGTGHADAAAGALFPVLTAALCWGWKAGCAAGICAFPANMLVLSAVGVDWRPGMLGVTGIVGHFLFILQGLIIGVVRDLYLQRKSAEQRLHTQIACSTEELERTRTIEQQLESVLEQSADGIFITQSGTETIIMVNRAFLELVGLQREDLIGDKPYRFLPDVGTTYRTTLGDALSIGIEYYEENYAVMQNLLTEGMIRNWEFHVINHLGELVPIEANVSNLLDPQGRRSGAIATVRDITERKRAERELSRANEFLNNIIENSIDSIIISDNSGRITHVNRSGLELTGFAQEDLLGKTPVSPAYFEEGFYETTAGEQIWISREEIESVYARMDDFLRDGKISNFIFYIMCNDGRLVEVEASITRLYDQQDNAVGSVSILRDRTLRSRMEKELSRQSDQLAQANCELESFAYSVSHDLRAPLRSISGFSSALEEDFGSDLPEEAGSYLQRIKNASRRMSLLIDDILKLSRISRQEMHSEQVSLSAIADEILAQRREHEPMRNVACAVQPGITARGDASLLRILLENLFDNAWKYTARQELPEISLSRADEADPRAPGSERTRPIFCVHDNGVGFDMAYADKLFGAFQRLHAEQDFPGTGIGLATVQRIVYRHGGRVWATGELGKGAAFYFTLG